MTRRREPERPAVKRAALHARVSTTVQETEGTSLGTQEEAMRAHAAERGYQVVHATCPRVARPQLRPFDAIIDVDYDV
jgi:hypothetical protein